MRCYNCGWENPDTVQRCEKCNTYLREDESDLRKGLSEISKEDIFPSIIENAMCYCQEPPNWGKPKEHLEHLRQVGWLINTKGEASVNYKLYEGRNIIGRDASCDILIQDSYVSKDHATIRFQDGKFAIQDNMSSNGTFVNGKDIDLDAVYLKDGDVIKVGETILEFYACEKDISKKMTSNEEDTVNSKDEKNAMSEITIGRKLDNDVVINDPMVGRRVAKVIKHNDGHYSIVDLMSTNGVYVNGKQIPAGGEVIINNNDVILIGKISLNLEEIILRARLGGLSIEDSTYPLPDNAMCYSPAPSGVSLGGGKNTSWIIIVIAIAIGVILCTIIYCLFVK